MANGKGGKVVTSVEAVVKPVVEELGYELVDVEYVKEGPDWFLRIYADKKGGITIDELAHISETVEPLIDELDPIQTAYTFEVSSPGLDRPLKTDNDFARYVGEDVDVSLFAPKDGSKQFTGKLLPKENGLINIETQDKKVLSFEEKAVALVKRTIVF